jgi:hypothetical protein
VRTFARFSSWMSVRGVAAADLDEGVVDEYVRAEQVRSGTETPAAFQYMPLVKRFLAERGVFALRGPVSRDRGGIPRLAAGPLSQRMADLVQWLQREGYARGTVISVACTAARLSEWMEAERLDLMRLDDELLAQFVAAQQRGRSQHPSSARRIAAVRRFLLDARLLTVHDAP